MARKLNKRKTCHESSPTAGLVKLEKRICDQSWKSHPVLEERRRTGTITHSLPKQLILSQVSPQGVYDVLEQKWLAERRLYSRHALLSWSMNHALLTKVKTGRDSLLPVFQGVVAPWLLLASCQESKIPERMETTQLDGIELEGLFRAVDQQPDKFAPYIDFARAVIVPQRVEHVFPWLSSSSCPPFLRVWGDAGSSAANLAHYAGLHMTFLKQFVRDMRELPACLADLVAQCCWPRLNSLIVYKKPTSL